LHVVSKGRIISANGITSPQLDILVLSSSYPRGLLTKKLYLAAGVCAPGDTLVVCWLDRLGRSVSTQ
jgi:hypothetical protein